jgi:hypothetical protein
VLVRFKVSDDAAVFVTFRARLSQIMYSLRL